MYFYSMRVIIVDDEVTSSQVLEHLLIEHVPNVEIISICNKAKDAVANISKMKPDLVFLDIELPDMTGFEILEKIPHIEFDIIFTTAYSQYGLKAIKYSAIDYLLKPISIEELKKAIEKARDILENKQIIERVKILLENINHLNENNPFNRIALPTNDGLKFVKIQQITRCSSSNNYTYIFLDTGEKFLVSKTLKEIENNFDSYPFCRVHNSHLINLNYIKKFVKSDIFSIILQDGTEIEVRRRKKDELIKMFNL